MLVRRFAAGMYAVQSIRPGCTGRISHPSLPDDRAMRSSLLRLLVRIDRCTGGVFRWRYHDPRRHVSELGKIVALDVPELGLQHARLGPFALRAELHIAGHGLEGSGTDIVADFLVVEPLGGL